MDFQPPYFPPPFPGAGVSCQVAGGGQDVFAQHLASADPYQHYAVSSALATPVYSIAII
jgi:hypothetical protein